MFYSSSQEEAMLKILSLLSPNLHGTASNAPHRIIKRVLVRTGRVLYWSRLILRSHMIKTHLNTVLIFVSVFCSDLLRSQRSHLVFRGYRSLRDCARFHCRHSERVRVGHSRNELQTQNTTSTSLGNIPTGSDTISFDRVAPIPPSFTSRPSFTC